MPKVIMSKYLIGLLLLIIIVVGVSFAFTRNLKISNNASSKIHIVAAENFYGDIANQLGGNHVSVVSILSDPNVDPHEYESNVSDGIAISKADIVIKNGDNYDNWMDKLLSASPNKNRTVLTGADIANNKLADNPHVWYGINNIQTIALKITSVLKQKDPQD